MIDFLEKLGDNITEYLMWPEINPRPRVLIHEVVHYVSYHKWSEFMGLAAPACGKLARSIKIRHIVNIEVTDGSVDESPPWIARIFQKQGR